MGISEKDFHLLQENQRKAEQKQIPTDGPADAEVKFPPSLNPQPKCKKHRRQIEKGLQTRCEMILRMHNVAFLHLTTFIKIKCFECNRFINVGIPGNKGLPDLILFLKNGRTMFIELKTDEGRLSPEQKAFKDMVLKLGFKYLIVRDSEIFQEIIKKHI